MKKIILVILCLSIFPYMAFGDCYADYKAKKNEPLRLHYGIAKINQSLCNSRDAVILELNDRLQADGWILLKLMDLFGRDDLEERKGNAGAYFLKY